MGSTQSTLQPPAVPRAIPQRPRRQTDAETYTTIDEKFDAVRISHDAGHGSSSHYGKILDTSDSSHVSGERTEEYVRELLKDSKNRLAYSALSTNNPMNIIEQPSALLKDNQYFNLTIPHEGSPVTNQRSSGKYSWVKGFSSLRRLLTLLLFGLARQMLDLR
jgi:bleomycin hydrolase